MELRHLRYFVTAAELGSITRAAEKLFIAQPPLSAQLKQLEEENTKLKKLVADLSLDKVMLQDVLSKNW